MSVVVAMGFPEEAIILCDSRISFSNKSINPKDELRKIYQLGPMLTVGFTSDHVEFTLEILRRITLYATKKSRSKATLYLLEKIPKVAIYYYEVLSKQIGWRPKMEFVYCGMIKDRGIEIDEKQIFNLMSSTKGSGRVPTQIGMALKTMRNGVMVIQPPSPIIIKQTFPSGKLSGDISYGFVASGSGDKIKEKLSDEFANLFFTEAEFPMRIYILRAICDEFIKESGIETIGGTVQTLKVTGDGVNTFTYSKKRINEDGSEKDSESLSFSNGKWVLENYEDGKKQIIRQNPLSIDLNSRIDVKSKSFAA